MPSNIGPLPDCIEMDLTLPDYTLLGAAIVDGEMWYAIGASKEVRGWVIKTFQKHVDYSFTGHVGIIDVSEQTFVMIKMKYATLRP